MKRVVWWLSLLAAASPNLLSAQVENGSGQLWLGGTVGVGTVGVAGGAAIVASGRDWAVTVRYRKSVWTSDLTESYTEDRGLLVGRVIRRPGGRGSISIGVGSLREWEMSCRGSRYGGKGGCALEGRTDGYGALIEAAIYPRANGGAFAWGFLLSGALSPVLSYMSVGITLGVGRTP